MTNTSKRAGMRWAWMLLLGGMASSGPALAATNTPAEIANEALVVDFYRALDAANATGTMAQQGRRIAEQYLSPDYTQHREGGSEPGSAREGFIRNAEAVPAGPLPPGMNQPAKRIALMADGDHVILVTSREFPDASGRIRPVTIFNMFRIADGKLAEHWDAIPAGLGSPPPLAPPVPR